MPKAMPKRRGKVYTTTEAASFLRTETQAVIRACQSGSLKHYIFGKRHRRIPAEWLIEFMQDNDMPETWIEEVNKDVQDFINRSS